MSLAQSALNQATLTVANPGPAALQTVTLSRGTPRATTPNGSVPDEQAVAQRPDLASEAWVVLPVHSVAQPGGGWVDQATFTLAVPTSGKVTQQLRLMPVGQQRRCEGASGRTRTHHTPVQATYPVALTDPTLGVTGRPRSAQGGPRASSM